MRKKLYKYGLLMLTSIFLLSGCGNILKNEKDDQTEPSTQHSTQEVGTESITEDSTENTEIESIISTEMDSQTTTESESDSTSTTESETESQTTTESENVVTDNTNNSQQNNNDKNKNDNNKNSNNKDNNNKDNNNKNNNNNNSNKNDDNKNTNDMVFVEGTTTDDSQLPIVKKVVKKIIKNGMSELEKAKAIHDYLVMNVDYDAKNYQANTIPRESYTAEGALKTKYAVCSGYAKAFQALCKASGLECEYVTGTGNGGAHGWNQVKIDGNWYNVDVTWDDPIKLDGESFDNHMHNRYDYFLIPDDIMYRDHKAENAKHVCKKSLHLEALRLGIPWGIYTFVENQKQFEAAVNEMVEKNEPYLNVMVTESFIPRFKASDYLKKAMLKLQVVDDYDITGSSIYPSDAYGIYRCTVYLDLETGKYSKYTIQSSEKDIKKELLRLVKENGPEGRYQMYISRKLLGDDFTYFKEHINRWAFYEHDLVVNHHTQSHLSDDVTKATFDVRKRTSEDHFQEMAYSISELEGFIKEMIQRNDSSLQAQLNYENIKLEGTYSADYELEHLLQEKFGEKYGLKFTTSPNNAYDNCIVVYIKKVDETQ